MPPAHTFALVWSQCLSDYVRGVSWDLMLTNLFLVIVRFAITAIELTIIFLEISSRVPRINVLYP